MKMFLNSKALCTCQPFQLISRQPRVPKLCWVSFSSSAFPGIYWCHVKTVGSHNPVLPHQFITVSTVTSHVADLGQLSWAVLSEAVYLREIALRWCIKCSWELDPGMPSSLFTRVVTFPLSSWDRGFCVLAIYGTGRSMVPSAWDGHSCLRP